MDNSDYKDVCFVKKDKNQKAIKILEKRINNQCLDYITLITNDIGTNIIDNINDKIDEDEKKIKRKKQRFRI